MIHTHIYIAVPVMGTPQHHPRRRRRRVSLFFATATTVAFLLLASVPPVLGFNPNHQFMKKMAGEELAEPVMARRRLSGPGSSPPTCRSKCGRCAPCRAVHVPIQPGFRLPLEYYPEAWRCECGKKLFMP